MHNLVVYTCITGGKDSLIPITPTQGVRYVCFSDEPIYSETWEHQPIEELGLLDKRRIARRYKVLSHIYFPGIPTIWIDGRIQLKMNPIDMLMKYQYDLCCRLHHERQCIYEEGAEVKRINYEDAKIVDSQMGRYITQGYPMNRGLHETGVLIRRHTAKTEQFNNAWWAEISAGSKRDQLSFDKVCHQLGITPQTIDRGDVSVMKHKIKTDIRN